MSHENLLHVWAQEILRQQTNIYNFMSYIYFSQLLSANLISQICIPSTKTGNELYIWNDGYPNNSSDCATSSGCACSISASKSSTIEIELLDLRLSQSGGTCSQRLVISEGGTETSIDCGQQNDFSLTSVYSSQSDSLTVRFDNTVSGQYGHFWILLRGNFIVKLAKYPLLVYSIEC